MSRCTSTNYEGKRCQRGEHSHGDHVHAERFDPARIRTDGEAFLLESISTWPNRDPAELLALGRDPE